VLLAWLRPGFSAWGLGPPLAALLPAALASPSGSW
jgi:hypothetical protein